MKLILLLLLVKSVSLFCQKKSEYGESKYYTDSIYSESLREYRKFNVYVPKNFNPSNKIKIIYATDGLPIGKESIDYMHAFDSIFDKAKKKSLLFVSVHCNTIKTKDSITFGNNEVYYLPYRNFEYVKNSYEKGISDNLLESRFSNHFIFFTNELIPAVESRLHVHCKRRNRVFYGCSNGAGFGLWIAATCPELIKNYLCFSTVSDDLQDINPTKTNYPVNIVLRYGTEEGSWTEESNMLIAKNFNKKGYRIDSSVYVGGHNAKLWNDQLMLWLEKNSFVFN